MEVYLSEHIAPSAYARLARHFEIVDNFDHPERLAAMIGDCRAHCDSVLSTLGNTCINVTGELRRAENSISSLPAAFNALRSGLEKLEEDK